MHSRNIALSDDFVVAFKHKLPPKLTFSTNEIKSSGKMIEPAGLHISPNSLETVCNLMKRVLGFGDVYVVLL